MAGSAEAVNNHPIIENPWLHLRLIQGGLGAEAPRETRPETRRHLGRVSIEALEAEYDVTTQLAEIVDGQMYTELELTFDGDDLYGPDGRSLTGTSRQGLEDAKAAAAKNPNLQFEVPRREEEDDEVNEAVAIAKGNTEGYNILFLTTDYPFALEGVDKDIGGYNHRRRQAMARWIVFYPHGRPPKLCSQTLDGSNRQALEAVHEEFGFKAEPGELQGQRRHMKLADEELDGVKDRVVNTYDRSMTEQFGGKWYAGRQPVDYRNTYDFVRRQRDLVELSISLYLEGKLDERMYDLAATINARFQQEQSRSSHTLMPGLVSVSYKQFESIGRTYSAAGRVLEQEIRLAGRTARSRGMTFSACGKTWEAEGYSNSSATRLEIAGYGNSDRTGGYEARTWHGGKKYKNKKCLSCEKVKPEVGACKICEDCVNNPKKHKLGTTQGRTEDPKNAKVNKEPAKVISLAEAREKRQGQKAAI